MLSVNMIRGTVPRSRQTITFLKPYAQSLRAMAKPRSFGQMSTSYHDVSERREPLVRIIPML